MTERTEYKQPTIMTLFKERVGLLWPSWHYGNKTKDTAKGKGEDKERIYQNFIYLFFL